VYLWTHFSSQLLHIPFLLLVSKWSLPLSPCPLEFWFFFYGKYWFMLCVCVCAEALYFTALFLFIRQPLFLSWWPPSFLLFNFFLVPQKQSLRKTTWFHAYPSPRDHILLFCCDEVGGSVFCDKHSLTLIPF
jgi:hypothetical protein